MYIPLKVTTDYSILSSLIKVKDLVSFCVQNNIKACAICDKNLFGTIEFYRTCKQNNIKPIIGLEVIINGLSIYLYAMNYNGYKNLMKINTLIPENLVTIDMLEKYSNDILVIVPYSSKQLLNELNFYKYRYIGYENEEELKNALLISKNVVYVNNINIFRESDKEYLTYLDLISEEKHEYHHNYFDYQNLSSFDLEKMEEVNNLLNVEIDFQTRYIPKYKEGVDSFEFLSNLCLKGLKKRLNNEIKEEYLIRLKYELNVIRKMGFVDYFLIVYDYVLYAKKNNILVGPGRGSAAGSLVSYVIGITDINPIKYNLLFERFLNYERVTMPDIDIDFENSKREEVINYVKNRYGILNVAGGMTYATLKTRLVLREVSKILKVDEKLLNKFLKIINKDWSLQKNLENKVVKDYLKNYPELNKLYKISLKVEGLKKNVSTHAAGIVIASEPLDEIIPMYKNESTYLTGVPMEYLEDLGLLKMDFLALKNLTTIGNIIRKIPNFKLNNIPLNDNAVFELFQRADTDGIFQFETSAFKSALVKYEPQNFAELVACIALVRPGPSQELETYIKRKKGLEKVTYYHSSLENILKETYGVIVYQEQVISILVQMANFSYAEADNIRRAMSKKKEEIILREKEKFLQKSKQNGYDEKLAENVYEHIMKFSAYGFNKAHSVSYALVSYQMAYLKVHYPALFIFELLNNSLGSTELVKNYIQELKKYNLLMFGVSINNSTNEFVLKNNQVYFPFKLIKNIRSELISNLITERKENGIYQDIFDFFKRTVNFISKNEYIMLINSGCLKELNNNAHLIMKNLEVLINYGALYNDLGSYALIPELENVLDYNAEEKRLNEINSYGFYISNHPASRYLDGVVKVVKIKDFVFKNVVCYVMVENVKRIKTKKGEDMAFVLGSDETGNADFTVFPKNYYLLNNVNKNDLIKVYGTVTKRYAQYSIIVNNMEVVNNG